MAGDKRKQSLYLDGAMLDELMAEATRQDRPISWLVQQAWRIAQPEIVRLRPQETRCLTSKSRQTKPPG